MTIRGGVIDGDGVRTTWLVVNADDVTVDGLVARDAARGAIQSGGLDLWSADRFRLRNADLSGGPYAAVKAWNSADVVVEDSKLHDNRAIGLVGWRAPRTIVRRSEVWGNNPSYSADPGWEAGGLKWCESPGVLVEDSVVHHNGGVGVWFDCFGTGSSMRRVTAHHNGWAGMMVEIQDQGSIVDSRAWANGSADPRGWGWPADILISSSGNITVTGNVAAWSGQSISVISQNRDAPSSNGRGIKVHGNIVTKAPVWLQDWSGPLASDASNVRTPNTTVSAGDSRLGAAGVPSAP
jgi:hypothetical protein